MILDYLSSDHLDYLNLSLLSSFSRQAGRDRKAGTDEWYDQTSLLVIRDSEG